MRSWRAHRCFCLLSLLVGLLAVCSVAAAGDLRRRIVRRRVLLHIALRLFSLLLLLGHRLLLGGIRILREGRARGDGKGEGTEQANVAKLPARGHRCSPCW